MVAMTTSISTSVNPREFPILSLLRGQHEVAAAKLDDNAAGLVASGFIRLMVEHWNLGKVLIVGRVSSGSEKG